MIDYGGTIRWEEKDKILMIRTFHVKYDRYRIGIEG